METYKSPKSLLTFSSGLGDAVLSTPAVRRAQADDPESEFHVGVWNRGQEEVFKSIGVPTVRIPVESRLGFRRRVKNICNWPEVFVDLVKLSRFVHNYDRVICPVGLGPISYLTPFFRKVVPGDKERIMPMPYPRKVLTSNKYMGYVLQDQIDAFLGAEALPYFSPELTFLRAHSALAGRMWTEAGLDPKRSVVCNFRTSARIKDFTFPQIEAVVSLVSSHGLLPVVVNYTPELQMMLKEKFSGHKLAFAANPSALVMGEFLRMARAHVSGDTGLAHIAGVVGTPTLVAFGPSDSENWVCPSHKNVSSVQVNMACKTLTCRSRQHCHQPGGNCMSRIDMDEFAEKLQQVVHLT